VIPPLDKTQGNMFSFERQPNKNDNYTGLEGILSVCLCLQVSSKKRYTKKPKQPPLPPQLDPLGVSATIDPILSVKPGFKSEISLRHLEVARPGVLAVLEITPLVHTSIQYQSIYVFLPPYEKGEGEEKLQLTVTTRGRSNKQI
jgi:hypothetical protein